MKMWQWLKDHNPLVNGAREKRIEVAERRVQQAVEALTDLKAKKEERLSQPGAPAEAHR